MFRFLDGAGIAFVLCACSAKASSPGDVDAGNNFPVQDAAPTYRGDPVCDVLSAPARSGACVAVGGPVACNPVTQVPCPNGQECGPDNQGGTRCYDLAPNQSLRVCDVSVAAVDGRTCGAGLVATHSETTHEDRCAAFCCADKDCGSGQCVRYVHEAPPFDTVGECLNPVTPPR